MNLREFQAKPIFAKHGIRIPQGKTAKNAAEVRTIAETLTGPVVLKPQLGLKKRGKLGIITFCDTADAAEKEAERLFNLSIAGEQIETLLVEEKADIAGELYLAVAIDYSRQCPVIIVSESGGVDIEALSASAPQKILKLPIDVLAGPTDRGFAAISNFSDVEVAQHAFLLYSIFQSYDAEMVEINPLVRTKTGSLIAVDAVLNVNDAALFRQPEIASLKSQITDSDPIAAEANVNKWTYIDLPGDIAILSSGAGLTMTILDLIALAGGSAANFLDTAQIDEKGIYDAFELLVRAKSARAMLINIFAGLNRCDKLAEGIVGYLKARPYERPIVVRMIGNKEEAGHTILRAAGIEPFTILEEAVERVVELAKA